MTLQKKDHELEEWLRGSHPETASQLAATVALLKTLPGEEIPRPIRFVSDKVLVPAWWQRLPVWGTASAVTLAGAIVLHGWWTRPLPIAAQAVAPAVTAGAAAPEALTAIEKRLAVQYDRKLEAAVTQLRQEYDQKLEFERRAIQVSVEENFLLLRKQMNRMYVASASAEGVTP